MHKRSKKTEPVLSKWNEIYPSISIKKTNGGSFLMEGAIYTEDGFQFEQTFQYSADEFKGQLTKWLSEKWPVQYLLRDHYGAKLLIDNCVFQYIEFYRHTYKWDEEKGLIIKVQRTLEGPIEWETFNTILDEIPIHQAPQGWHLFDGWSYTQNGLAPVHLWQWKNLHVSYKFPQDKKPDICYVDIVTFNWEHDGLPGVLGGNPHGHTSIEFGDDLGNFYSVGMYMDPRSSINCKQEPGAYVRACLYSPDQYLPSKGEKSVHRYYLGSGVDGRNKIKHLIQHIEDIQCYTKDDITGLVRTCPRKYHVFMYNCGDFQQDIEKFTIEKLQGKLLKLDDNTIYVPGRRKVFVKSHWFYDNITSYWNKSLLLFVDLLIFTLVSIPYVNKKIGGEKQDDFSDFEPVKSYGTISNDGFTKFYFNNFKQIVNSLRPKSVVFPRKVRVEQLYSRRLKGYSVLLKTD